MVPDQIIDTLQGLYKEFMWNRQQPKIKHSTLISEYSHGGLCDIDIKSKILASKTLWIRKLKDKADFHPWNSLAKEFLSQQEVTKYSVAAFNLLLSLLLI